LKILKFKICDWRAWRRMNSSVIRPWPRDKLLISQKWRMINDQWDALFGEGSKLGGRQARGPTSSGANELGVEPKVKIMPRKGWRGQGEVSVASWVWKDQKVGASRIYSLAQSLCNQMTPHLLSALEQLVDHLGLNQPLKISKIPDIPLRFSAPPSECPARPQL
jgi:hypothetical protein